MNSNPFFTLSTLTLPLRSIIVKCCFAKYCCKQLQNVVSVGNTFGHVKFIRKLLEFRCLYSEFCFDFTVQLPSGPGAFSKLISFQLNLKVPDHIQRRHTEIWWNAFLHRVRSLPTDTLRSCILLGDSQRAILLPPIFRIVSLQDQTLSIQGSFTSGKQVRGTVGVVRLVDGFWFISVSE